MATAYLRAMDDMAVAAPVRPDLRLVAAAGLAPLARPAPDRPRPGWSRTAVAASALLHAAVAALALSAGFGAAGGERAIAVELVFLPAAEPGSGTAAPADGPEAPADAATATAMPAEPATDATPGPAPAPEPVADAVPDPAPVPEPVADAAPEPAPAPEPRPATMAERDPAPPPRRKPAPPHRMAETKLVPPRASPPRPEPPKPSARTLANHTAPPAATAEPAAEAAATGGVSPAFADAKAGAAPTRSGLAVVRDPRFRRSPTPPAYPPRALALSQEGTVLVRALVAASGESETVTVWRSSGHALLDDAAVRAVQQWAFEPARIGGRPMAAWIEVPVRFAIR